MISSCPNPSFTHIEYQHEEGPPCLSIQAGGDCYRLITTNIDRPTSKVDLENIETCNMNVFICISQLRAVESSNHYYSLDKKSTFKEAT